MNETKVIGGAGAIAAIAAVAALGGLSAAGSPLIDLLPVLPIPLEPGRNRRGKLVLKDPAGRTLKSTRRAHRNKYR